MDQDAIREALSRIQANDAELGNEVDRLLTRARRESAVTPRVMRSLAEDEEAQPPLTQETIVFRKARPVLAIAQDTAQLIMTEEDSELWKERLSKAEALLTPAIRAVGRIEVTGHPEVDWLGTGWLVRPDVVVTNRHVAEEFGRANGTAGFVFRRGVIGKPMSASVDFLEEANHTGERIATVRSILHIEGENGPDIAFLQVGAASSSGLAGAIGLATGTIMAKQQVAVIGYPARDSRVPDQDAVRRIFGNLYNKKRLAPGQINEGSNARLVLHDCSTLGGNSGSVVLGLDSGKAEGLHFSGRFLKANYAVSAGVIEERLGAALRGESTSPKTISIPTGVTSGQPADASPKLQAPGSMQFSCTIPIHLTITVGNPIAQQQQAAAAASPKPDDIVMDDFGDSDLLAEEGVPSDYLDRQGYDEDFLGDGAPTIPLPKIVANTNQVVTFSFNGNAAEHVLRYEHFSVAMRKDRRMCFFSAVNINGNEPGKEKRKGWKYDPRIPQALQIRNECYGNAPKFSRGHMTRREDPVWGDKQSASRGNTDSMHVTNAVPQMQDFNGTVWLELEDYALDQTKDDRMRVSVFTGPVFKSDDPVQYGVQIPVLFWKVIAFIHDETGELSATGYTMSQEAYLKNTEHIFGAFLTHQRSLSSIEDLSGLSFGPLTSADLFDDSTESAVRPLTRLSQIRFFKKR